MKSLLTRERVFAFFLFIAAGGLGYFYGKQDAPVEEEVSDKPVQVLPQSSEIREKGYNFISPLVECECYEPSKLLPIASLEKDLRDYIRQVINENRASHVSVYFRDLNNGPWMGINEDELFYPASLLKVPVMIAAFKKAESDPTFLKKKVVYPASMTDGMIQQYISDSLRLKPGKSYTIEDLIFRMTAYSDNRALNLLTENMEIAFIDQVERDIQLSVSGVRTPYDMISVRAYSSFFRILYNASYLNREMSEKALKMLSKSSFTQGLVAGLPDSVKVSHKFGERGTQGRPDNQLHDCGIIYHHRQPYLLCVMTRGKNFQELCSVISDVSGIVYKSVNEN